MICEIKPQSITLCNIFFLCARGGHFQSVSYPDYFQLKRYWVNRAHKGKRRWRRRRWQKIGMLSNVVTKNSNLQCIFKGPI